MSDMNPGYQAITGLPRHIEEKLLTFNVLQLCALVCEKPGTKWSGASDRYGPISEIEKRWKLEELAKRIADMKPEEPLLTYARVMTDIGGNPARAKEVEKREDNIRKIIESKMKPLDQDVVRTSLAGCEDMAALKKVAAEHGLPIDADRWAKIDGLANFGLKRMYVGNVWRTMIPHAEKGAK